MSLVQGKGDIHEVVQHADVVDNAHIRLLVPIAMAERARAAIAAGVSHENLLRRGLIAASKKKPAKKKKPRK